MGSNAALDQYCGSVFWNDSFLDATPDLPLCFENTVLVWVPLAFLWLLGSWRLVPLCRERRKPCHVSRLYLSKQLVVGLLFITAIAGLGLTLGEDYSSSSGPESHALVFYINPTLYAISWILVALLHEEMRRRDRAVDSSVLFLFWLLHIVCDIFPFQTLVRQALTQEGVTDLPRFCLFLIAVALRLLLLVLSSWADIPPHFQEHVRRNPELGAAFLSRITFNWFNSLIVGGWRRPLVQDDLWDLKESDSTASLLSSFRVHMESGLAAARLRMQRRALASKMAAADPDPGLQSVAGHDVLLMEDMKGKKKKKKLKPGKESGGKEVKDFPKAWLMGALGKTFWKTLLSSGIFKLLTDLLAFVGPQLLGRLISFVKDPDLPDWYGYGIAVLLAVIAIFQSMFLQQYFQQCYVIGMQIRSTIMASVYKKAMLLTNESRKESTVGETVNLISADAQRFNDSLGYLHMLWSCPLQILLSVGFLWQELGPSSLAGLAVMVAIAPINLLFTTKARILQTSNMVYKDKRLKIINEILNSMKILKLFGWEPSFHAQVEGIRNKELKVMKKFSYLNAAAMFLFYSAPSLVSLATFGVYLASSPDNVLDAEKAFTSMALFNLLRFPLNMLPIVISIMVQAVVSNDRLEKFLAGDDLDPDIVHHDPSFNTAVSICNGTFSWEEALDPVLKDISLDVGRGKLVAVVGAVGSGKSSLISAILGELHSVKGFVNVQGSLAYVPQQAWIQNVTLRDNILFGSPDDKKRFQAVLEACALIPDLELLPARDLTEIGEKGINLSGGQKQRVSLARAAFSQSDIYLLDDPLSAVDSHVGKHLFEEVIGPKGLLKHKTRILVTHGVSFLPYVDEIVVMVNGVVSEVGSYQSLRANRGAFSEFLDEYAKEESTKQDEMAAVAAAEVFGEELEAELEAEPQADCAPEDAVVGMLKREGSLRRSRRKGSVRSRANSSARQKEAPDALKKGQRLIENETMETGKVRFSIYLQYLRAMGWWYSLAILLLYILSILATMGSNIWLSAWAGDAEAYANTTYPSSLQETRIGVYGALAVGQGLVVFLGTWLMADSSVAASRVLHAKLLRCVLRVPMSFFDTTPTGRLTNRFAKDMLTVDEAIPISLRSWLLCAISVIGTLVIIIMVTPIFAAVVVPLGVLYYVVQLFYLATCRQLKRLDSVSRSPIYSHFSETMSGLSVVRAYGHQDRFLRRSEATIDDNVKSVYPWIVSNRWLAIRLEFVGNLVVFFSALLAVIARKTLESGTVGLSVSYALNVTQTLNWLVRMTSELENNIVAVERVSEYSTLEAEADWVCEPRPPMDWPETGRVQFDNYMVRYRAELGLVLKGVTCDVSGAEKIGIVGRTGAGKSSLTNCLFRIMEAADGRIVIDGIDISKIGLHDLRTKLTIIPQDPVLFSGSLRMNLDPFETFSDEDVWRTLELAHLKEFVCGLEKGLHYEIQEGGENLSVGQRQLLCLARALLHRSRILILDEATAAVDLETDGLIQATIRKEFSNCTVFTIAHRLHTIMDSTRVMVLDEGRIVEFDTPDALMEMQGVFYSMTKDAGISTAEVTSL